MKFKLMNYTTTITAEKSIMEIEKMLSLFGASAIMKEYLEDGRLKSLSFKLQEKGYRIPANVEGVYEVLYKDKRVSGKRNAMMNRKVNADNVSWRIIKDWLHAQLSIIASGQAQPDEVMLPYMWDGKRTLYQAYKEGRLQLENKEEIMEGKNDR